MPAVVTLQTILNIYIERLICTSIIKIVNYVELWWLASMILAIRSLWYFVIFSQQTDWETMEICFLFHNRHFLLSSLYAQCLIAFFSNFFTRISSQEWKYKNTWDSSKHAICYVITGIEYKIDHDSHT